MTENEEKLFKNENPKRLFLSTVDNPFNPFVNFDAWNNYDKFRGYNTCQFLARLLPNFTGVSEFDEIVITNQVIREVFANNVRGIDIIVEEK